jgi:DHA2 family multidrug resistance protein
VLPISAFFARLLGRKRYFLLCIVAFAVCSFLCGIATNLGELIVFRVLQGFFGGGLQPNQQSIILDTFPPAQRSRAFSISAVAIVVAPVLGPTLGGWITDHYSWRWVFLLNVPFGILTTLGVQQLVDDPPWAKTKRERLSIDYIGIGLLAIGLGCLQVMLDRGEDADWFGSTFIRVFAAMAAIGLVGAALWLSYARKPVVRLDPLKDRNFALGSVAMAAFAMILYGSSVLIPQLAQQRLGYTATLAGLVLSPGALLITLEIPIISKIMPHVETRFFIGLGFALLAAALAYAHWLTPDIDYQTLVMMRNAQSFAIGCLFVPTTALAYLSVPRDLNNDASARYVVADAQPSVGGPRKLARCRTSRCAARASAGPCGAVRWADCAGGKRPRAACRRAADAPCSSPCMTSTMRSPFIAPIARIATRSPQPWLSNKAPTISRANAIRKVS